MKPSPNQDISTENVARLKGGEVEPLSKLAAFGAQSAEHFALTKEDKKALADVLEDEDLA